MISRKKDIFYFFIAKEKREAENGNGKVEEMDVRPVRERILSVVCPLHSKHGASVTQNELMFSRGPS